MIREIIEFSVKFGAFEYTLTSIIIHYLQYQTVKQINNQRFTGGNLHDRNSMPAYNTVFRSR